MSRALHAPAAVLRSAFVCSLNRIGTFQLDPFARLEGLNSDLSLQSLHLDASIIRNSHSLRRYVVLRGLYMRYRMCMYQVRHVLPCMDQRDV